MFTILLHNIIKNCNFEADNLDYVFFYIIKVAMSMTFNGISTRLSRQSLLFLHMTKSLEKQPKYTIKNGRKSNTDSQLQTHCNDFIIYIYIYNR